MEKKQIKTALISVFHKDGLLPAIIQELHKQNVVIYSTGGTHKFITELGVPVNSVEQITKFPEMMGGRVKTLHPIVFGGILADRGDSNHMDALATHNIPEIDLVIVDLYPFTETLKKTVDEAEIIEQIDIGGIALIRAAAKNFNDVVVVGSKDQYSLLLEKLQNGNETTREERRIFATHAWNVSSHYDTEIFNYFNEVTKLPVLKISVQNSQELRYGENPHQQGKFFGNLSEILTQCQGKELSYNNLADIDAAIDIIDDFPESTVAIIKHKNPCGLATRETNIEAFQVALQADTKSAFGGIVITNEEIGDELAEEMVKIFFEVIIAPSYTESALAVFSKKKNLIIVQLNEKVKKNILIQPCLNGFLEQTENNELYRTLDHIAGKELTIEQKSDAVFGLRAIKHLKSNAIALISNENLVGMGCGQVNRVDALRDAIRKAKEAGFDPANCVMVSEAFFPMTDCVDVAFEAGIKIIIQPGGSIKDEQSIQAANTYGQTMVLTGIRHFKH